MPQVSEALKQLSLARVSTQQEQYLFSDAIWLIDFNGWIT